MNIIADNCHDRCTYNQKNNNYALTKQRRKARRMKEKLLKEAKLQRASEEHIDAYYYIKMSQSRACWNTEEAKNGVMFTHNELARHLKTIIRKEQAMQNHRNLHLKHQLERCCHSWASSQLMHEIWMQSS